MSAGTAASGHPTAHVGPNAVIQLAAALRDGWGEALTRQVFALGGASGWLEAPPQSMVPQEPVARLHAAVRAVLPRDQALVAARDAGRRTALYLLAHRIPKPAQAVMAALPAGLAARALLALIRANAWTFAGSGRLSTGSPGWFEAGWRRQPGWIEIADNPLAGHPCAWHEGVFGLLFARLVSARARVTETQCGAGAQGASSGASCRFEITLESADAR